MFKASPVHASPRDRTGVLRAAAAALRMVWCCAGPLIVAGAGLGVTGGVLSSAWLVTVGMLIILAGAGHALRCRGLRRRGLTGPDDCCSNTDVPAA